MMGDFVASHFQGCGFDSCSCLCVSHTLHRFLSGIPLINMPGRLASLKCPWIVEWMYVLTLTGIPSRMPTALCLVLLGILYGKWLDWLIILLQFIYPCYLNMVCVSTMLPYHLWWNLPIVLAVSNYVSCLLARSWSNTNTALGPIGYFILRTMHPPMQPFPHRSNQGSCGLLSDINSL